MAGGMKRLAKETAVYGLSSIIGRFLNWMLVPMYTRVLAGTGDYGIVTNLYGWTALLLVLLTYGMETGFFRFINKKEEQEPMRVYASVLYCLLGSSMLFAVVVFALLPWISGAMGYADHPEYVGMMAGIVAVDAFCCIPFAYLRYLGKAWRFAGIKLLSIFLNIALNIFFLLVCPWLQSHYPAMVDWFYIPDYGVGYVFVANVFTTLLTLFCLFPDILPGLRAKCNPVVLRQILRYSFPILLLGIAGIFNQTADKILFPFLFDDKVYANEQLGIYGACFKIAVVMVMFTQAFRYAYEPFIFARNKSDDNKLAYAEAMKYFILFALFIFLGVMFYIDVLKYFVGSAYYPGLRVVPIVMLGELFFGIYFNLSLWYKLIDETRWGAYFSSIGCVATVSIILLFGVTYGYMACAWAGFAAYGISMVASYIFGQKYYPINYPLRDIGFYVLLAAIIFGIMTWGNAHLGTWLSLGVNTLLLVAFLAVIIKRDFGTVLRKRLKR